MSMETPKYKVLLVDNDDFLLSLYVEKSERYNLELFPFTDAEHALEELRKGFQPDVLVIDIGLPDMDGLELIAHIKNEKLATDAPIIVLTNKSESPYPEKVQDLNIERYIVKATFLPSEVMEVILDLIREKSNDTPTS